MKLIIFDKMRKISNLSNAMKPDTIVKNGASSKNRMSRGKFVRKIFFSLLIACIFSATNIFAQQQGDVTIESQQTTSHPSLGRHANWVTDSSTGVILKDDELRRIMQINPAALQILNEGIKQRNTGMVIAIPAAIPLVVGLFGIIDNISPFMSDGYNNWALPTFLIGGGVYTIGMVVGIKGRNKVFQAVEIYNKGLAANKPEMELNFGFTGNGIGLTLRF